MDQRVADDIFEAGLSAGADFIDLYEEETRNAAVSLRDHKIENATAGIEYGIGLRLLYGTDVVYGYTSSDSREALMKLLQALVAARGGIHAGGTKKAASLKQQSAAAAMQTILRRPEDAGQAAKLPLLLRAEKAGYAISPSVALFHW